MQLAPSLHRIGSDMVNVYLITEPAGITVIDAGIPGLWKELVAELASMGRSVDDIKGLILTHADSDHLGFAERLRREHGVTIYVHEADAAQARGEVEKKNPPWGKVKIGPTLSFLWYAGLRGGMKVIPVTEVQTVRDGDVLDLPGRPRVIHTPGHSPGSIAIYSETVGALFVGDAMTTRHVLTGAGGPQPAPFTLDEDMAMASLQRWDGIDARWVLPGHGHPWDGGVEAAVARIEAAAAG
jgi:glyoxylase-like metal-dependent hydrolase (beta-lactamase superfamily II)